MRKILLILLFFVFMSCATKSTTTKDNGLKPEEELPTENEAVILPTPTIIDTPTQADIEDRLLDSRMIHNVEIGSPASLRKAVDFIAADPKGLNDVNRLYLVIISEIMKRLYPHESITWNVPNYHGENKYLAAFSQIDDGIIPQNLDSSTFLSIILPCFYVISEDLTEEQFINFANRLEKAKELIPQSVLPHFLSGLMYEKNGQSSKAEVSYKNAYSLDSSCTQAGLNYTRILAKNGNSSTALDIMKNLDTLKNTNEYKLILSASYIGTKQYDKASEIVVALLTQNPENIEAVLLRIKILIAKQEYLKANALLDAFATKNKTNKDYLLLRASLVLNWSRSTSSALTLLNQAYEYYPNDFDVLLACAQICFETGQNIQGYSAEDFIAKVTEKDAKNSEAAKLLVKNAIGNENWQLAVPKAEALNEENPSIENSQLLAKSYLGSGQISKALNLARDLYSQDAENDDRITALYLEALSRTGNASEILRIINAKMSTATNELKSILYYYQSTISSGDVKLSYLRSSLLADPRNIDALFAMYQYYYASGDLKKSEYYLKQVVAIDPLNQKNVKLLQNLQTKLQ